MPWTAAEKKYFHQQAVSLITTIWQGVPKISLKGSSAFARRNAGNFFQFRFDIQQVNAGEHWTVSANKIANNRIFKSYVNWSARRIVLDIKDIAPDQKTNGTAQSLQFPVVHEFGHAIGNISMLYLGSHGDEYRIDLAADSYSSSFRDIYNYADYQIIMNIGSYVRERHFDYLLRELNTMIPGTIFYFNSLMRW
jgi:hypothetical protein